MKLHAVFVPAPLLRVAPRIRVVVVRWVSPLPRRQMGARKRRATRTKERGGALTVSTEVSCLYVGRPLVSARVSFRDVSVV